MREADEDDWLELENDATLEFLSLQAPPEGDFLGSPTGKADDSSQLINVVQDDITPRVANPDLPAGVDPRMAEAILAAKRLLPRQRTFIRSLIQEGGDVPRAVKLYNARTQTPVTTAQAHRWFRLPDFALVYRTAAKEYLDYSGIDPQGVMVKAVNLHNDAMRPAPILHQGRHTGYYERDRATAARVIEFMGKVNKMTHADENRARVVVQIIDMSGQAEVSVTDSANDV